MAQTIKLKNSGTSSNTPSSLEHGELAINYADGKIFYKNSSNNIVEFANLSGSFLPLSGGTLTGNLSLGDNVKLQLGDQTNGDLQIYHDGSHSYIKDNGTGNLNIQTNGVGVVIEDTSESNLAVFNAGNGIVTLYKSGSPKLATTSTGIQVTGDISNASGDLTLDVAGDISLDADGGDIRFKDGGTEFLQIFNNSTDAHIYNANQDKDILIQGNDGGSTVTAVRFDMSSQGDAIFNNDILLGDSNPVRFGTDQDFRVSFDGSHAILQNVTSNSDIVFKGNDGGSTITALTLDMSSAGAASFNSTISSGAITSSGVVTVSKGGSTAAHGDTDLLVRHSSAASTTAQAQILAGNAGYSNLYFSDTDSYNVGGFIYNHASNYLATNVNGSEKLRVDSQGRLGLGTALPQQKLHVVGGQARFDDHISIQPTKLLYLDGGGDTFIHEASANNIAFNSGGGERVRINTTGLGIGNSSPTTILDVTGNSFHIGDGSYEGFLGKGNYALTGGGANNLALRSAADIVFGTGGDNIRAVIDSSGNLLVGKTSTGIANTGVEARSNGLLFATADGSSAVQINRLSSDGELLEFKKDGTVFGDIRASNSTSLTLNARNTGNMIFQSGSSEKMRMDSSGRLGIGVTSPQNKLHVYKGDSGHTWNFDGGDGFILENSDSVSINIAVPAANSGNILFSDANARGQGRIAYEHSSDSMSFMTGGVSNTRLKIDSSGNVGIAVTSPTHKIHVNNDNDYAAKFGGTGGGDYSIEIGQGSTNSSAGFNATGSGGSMLFKVQDSEYMRIKSNGNVGIGTTSPDSLLHLKSTGDTRMTIESPDANDSYINFSGATNEMSLGFDTSDAAMYITNHGTITANRRVTIKTNGNVGIGTTSPDSKLSVTSSTINSEDIVYLKSGADNVNDYLGIAWELGIGGNGPHAAIRASGGPSASDCRLGFYTTSDGGTNLTEGLFLAHNGGVTIGTTTVTNSGGLLVHNDIKTNSRFGVGSLGTVGTPALHVLADTDTGIYFPDFNHIGLVTGGVERLQVDSSGRVGINRAPSITNSKLEVGGADNVPLINVEASGNTGGMGIGSSGLQFFHGSSSKMVINSSGNVGIGSSTSLTYKLQVRHDVLASTDLDPASVRLYNNSDGGAAILFENGVSAKSKISFGVEGTGASTDETFIGFSTGANTSMSERFRINSSGSCRWTPDGTNHDMTLTSGGNLLIGKTADNDTSAGIRFQSNGSGSFVRNNNVALQVNRLTGDGSLMEFRKDSSLVGIIGTGNSGNLFIGSGDAGINFNKDVNSVYPINAETGGATTLDLGLSAYRFKDAHFSGTVNSVNVNVGGGTVADPTLTIDSAASGDPRLVFDTSQVNRTAIIQFKDQGSLAGGFINYKHQYDRLDFGAQSSTDFQLSVVNSGVMIGATTPYRNLLVAFTSTDTNTSSTSSGFGNTSNVGTGLMINNTSTTNNTYAPLDFKCGTNNVYGRIAYKATDMSDEFGQFEFITMDDGSAVNALTIASGGNGTFAGSCTATSFPTSSDARLKDNIEPARDSGDIIDKIKVRQFDWKKTGKHQDYGMIAQELILEVPDAVSTPTEDHEMMGIDYSKLVPLMMKEIQNLRKEIKSLKEKE